jgi:hypothetical protein
MAPHDRYDREEDSWCVHPEQSTLDQGTLFVFSGPMLSLCNQHRLDVVGLTLTDVRILGRRSSNTTFGPGTAAYGSFSATADESDPVVESCRAAHNGRLGGQSSIESHAVDFSRKLHSHATDEPAEIVSHMAKSRK